MPIVALSTLATGACFTFGTDVPTQKYVLTKYTAADPTLLICYNLIKSVFVEVPNGTMVKELPPTIDSIVVITV